MLKKIMYTIIVLIIAFAVFLSPQFNVLKKSSDPFLEIKSEAEISLQDTPLITSYIINLDRSPDRYEYVLPNIEKLGYPITRISAVDGKLLTEQRINRFVDKEAYKKILLYYPDKGTIGCSLSHINTWKDFLSSGSEYALIVEDDIKFDPIILRVTINELIQNKQLWDIANFEMLQIGSPLKLKKISDNKNIVVYLRTVMDTGCYIINRKAARKLLAKALPIKMPVDWYFTRTWELGLRFVGVEPRIVHQVLPDSEIDKTRKVAKLQKLKLWEIISNKIYSKQASMVRFLYNLQQYIISSLNIYKTELLKK